MNEKVIFISHSSKDAEFAHKVCAVMENNGLPCWIAPRDIPYGNHWCEEIVTAISESRVMLFIYSESSNKSKHVAREIHQADKRDVLIIPVRLTDTPYNLALDYLIDLDHHLLVDNKRVSLQLTELARRITLFINDKDYVPDNRVYNKYFDNLDLAIDKSVNIDKHFEDTHSVFALFSVSEKAEESIKESSLKKRLIQRAGEVTLNNMFKEEKINEFSYTDENSGSSDNSSSDSNNSEENGKYFYCYEAKNNYTMAFMVSYIINEEDFNCIMITTPLDKLTKERSDGDKDVCFFVDNPDYEGNPLLLATIDEDNKIVTWSLGFLDGDTLKISKAPANIQEISISDDNYKSIVRYSANEFGVIILDVENHKVVERNRYFDSKTQKWEYYVELLKNNNYILFKPRFGSAKSPAKPFNIGYGYYKGKYGLRKNAIEAAAWFEKAATKEAYFYLAEIFKNDPVLKNEDDYNYYMSLYNFGK